MCFTQKHTQGATKARNWHLFAWTASGDEATEAFDMGGTWESRFGWTDGRTKGSVPAVTKRVAAAFIWLGALPSVPLPPVLHLTSLLHLTT